MKYLTLSADYGRPSLRHEGGDDVPTQDAGLPADIRDAVAAWNERYQPIIQLSPEERSRPETRALIDELDAAGKALAAAIGEAFEGETKVKYFSEGHLRYLP